MDQPRTVSREGSVLRHPTPDLQSIQGAYVGNIERLEQKAERLSLSSDMGEELRKMRIEQRESHSRRSSILDAHNEEREADIPLHRQFSYEYGSRASNSIVGTNSVARNGGFSPAAYYASPRSSVRSGSWSHQNSVKERSLSYGTRLQQVSEPEQEGKPLDSPLSNRLISLAPQPESPTKALRVTNDEQYNLNNVEIPHTRPEESEMADDAQQLRASSDTYRQAAGLFTDFDGVHIAPHSDSPLDLNGTTDRRVSSQPIPIRPVSYMQPTPDENMVYYPAPVPMMLNLPKRLSKLPAAPHRDKRRSELLDNLPTDARKSAAWLPDVLESTNGDVPHESEDSPMHVKERKRRTMANMPPQLRATMFFDYPSTHQDVEVKGDSAVATLDSILDASAFAPVSAFTDHPIAGPVGSEVYGKAPVRSRASAVPADVRDPGQRRSTIDLLTKRNSSSNLLENTKKRNSSLMSLGGHFGKRKSSAQQFEDAQEHHEADAADLYGEDAPLQRSHEEFDGLADEETDFHDAREEMLDGEDQVGVPEEVGEYNGAPTTLLAELQLRKLQQKQRGRTAATAFPDGMHSTLLQLDAVAQVQKQSRRQKHTTLAWEDPEVHHLGAGDQDDEDVPLGVLFPGRTMDANDKSRLFDEDRPLGLIAKRDMEDNEPLSHRRARLRGEDPKLRTADPDKRNSMYTLDLPKFSEENPQPENDDEDETLAQRIRRLKATNIPTQPRPVSGDFASEILSQLNGFSPAEQPSKDEASAPRTATKTPGPDETLGQRRKRLQREANKSRNVSGESNESAARPAMTTRHSMATILAAHPAAGASTRPFNEIKFAPAPKTRNTPWAMNQTRKASMGPMRGLPMASGLGASNGGYVNGITATSGANGFPNPMMQQPVEAVNPRQNEMIDRWRQSVTH
ncbi:MAG: hypothetical protein Q9161_006001 [Pseudevernia consocians]